MFVATIARAYDVDVWSVLRHRPLAPGYSLLAIDYLPLTNVVGLAIGEDASTHERYRPLFQLPSDRPAGARE